MKRQETARFDFLLSNNFKANCTFFMSLIAIALFVVYPTRARELCMYAILISTLADLVLMDYHNLPGLTFGKKRFYVGMALFGITHVIYMFCFSNIIIRSGKSLYIPESNIAFVMFGFIFCLALRIATATPAASATSAMVFGYTEWINRKDAYKIGVTVMIVWILADVLLLMPLGMMLF